MKKLVITIRGKDVMKRNIAGLLFGIGLCMGFIPILIASLLVKHNLFIEAIDRMDGHWKQTENLPSNV